MEEILLTAGMWLGVMALIGIALLLTKRIADAINRAREKTTQKQIAKTGQPPMDEFRNPFYISEEEISAFKEATEENNKKDL